MKKSPRDIVSFVLSGAFHVVFALALVSAPKHLRERYEVVDLAIDSTKPKPEQKLPKLEPEPEEEPPKEPEKKKAPKRKPKQKTEEEPPPPPEPEEKAPEEQKEEAPPVFDLGDNTFAENTGQGSAWALNRSEGNTKIAAVAGKNASSVRDTKPKGQPGGKPGGTGKEYAPVPLKDLSKRPMPKDGPPPAPPYPAEARRAGIEGPVILQVFITKKGTVKRVRVVKSPSELLSKEAKTAMLKILWTPPLDKMGRPVDTVIVWTYRYVLDG